MMRRRRSAGISIGFGLIVVAILMILATCVATISTTNLNMAFQEELRSQAYEVAQAGIHQFLTDVEKGLLDGNVNPVTAGPNLLEDSLTGTTDAFLAVLPAAGPLKPYPLRLPPGVAPRVEGQCFITFAQGKFLPGTTRILPHSTSNLNGAEPVIGFANRPVPGFTVDVIATGVARNNTIRTIAAKVTRRWSYAVASAHPIFITNDPEFPTQIDGDVYTLAKPPDGVAAITMGFDRNGNAGPFNVVKGELVTTLNDGTKVRVAETGTNKPNGVRLAARELQYPDLQDVPGTGENLAGVKLNGCFLELKPNAGAFDDDLNNGKPTYVIRCDPGVQAPMVLIDKNYFLDGNLSIEANSPCRGLVLQRTTLKVRGTLKFVSRATSIYGVESALSVDEKFIFRNGFLDGGKLGFVIKAKSIETFAGGEFRGLIIVDRDITMESLKDPDLEANTGSILCGGGGGGGGGGPPPPPPPQPPPLAGGADIVNVAAPPATATENVLPDQVRANSTVQPVGDRYPFKIVGAVLAPKRVNIFSNTPVVLKSIIIRYDPRFLRALNSVAPLNISAWEEFN